MSTSLFARYACVLDSSRGWETPCRPLFDNEILRKVVFTRKRFTNVITSKSVKNHQDVVVVKCVIHTPHYCSSNANFLHENTKKKKTRGKEGETGCFQSKVTNYMNRTRRRGRKQSARHLGHKTRSRLRSRSRI